MISYTFEISDDQADEIILRVLKRTKSDHDRNPPPDDDSPEIVACCKKLIEYYSLPKG